jgi:L-serine dehydratase
MSVFDILGPIMIGPSSSHTAGAARIGFMAKLIFDDDVEAMNIFLHGSFAETGPGHGTDRAVVGGILGFKPDDERIKDSFKFARDMGIEVNFNNIKLSDVHPNTVLIELVKGDRSLKLIASSIGGGNIIVSNIDDYEVNLSGKLPTLWIIHRDKPGKVGLFTSILGSYMLNIANMQVFRKKKGTLASSIIELDHEVNKYILDHLIHLEDIIQVRFIPPL